jgi:hypothetical protein
VAAVETLGAKTLVVGESDFVSEGIIARIGRDTALAIGDCVELLVDPGALHLFDPATTPAIIIGTGGVVRAGIRIDHGLEKPEPCRVLSSGKGGNP